jgi:hypothetical protein
VCLGFIRHLIAHSRSQLEAPTIRQLGIELAGKTEEDMPFFAPVIGAITG